MPHLPCRTINRPNISRCCAACSPSRQSVCLPCAGVAAGTGSRSGGHSTSRGCYCHCLHAGGAQVEGRRAQQEEAAVLVPKASGTPAVTEGSLRDTFKTDDINEGALLNQGKKLDHPLTDFVVCLAAARAHAAPGTCHQPPWVRPHASIRIVPLPEDHVSHQALAQHIVWRHFLDRLLGQALPLLLVPSGGTCRSSNTYYEIVSIV